MKFSEREPYYQEQLARIKKLADDKTLWMYEARDVVTLAGQDIANTDSFLQLLHQAQRLNRIALAGVENNSEFRQVVLQEKPPMWENFSAPPVDDALQESLARKLYNATPGAGDRLYIVLDRQARKIGPWLLETCRAENVPAYITFTDGSFQALLLTHASDDGVRALGADLVAMTDNANKRVGVHSGMPAIPDLQAPPEKAVLYKDAVRPLSQRGTNGDLFFTITSIPTPQDAEIDGIPYDDYMALFFEMCDQPWDRISAAQKELIREFNAASTVRITNNDGTDVSMDIEGFTFCNSLIAKNVPGSEIFSAMRIDSLEGTIVARGRFMTRDHELVENLTLTFRKGELVAYTADAGLEAFEKAISVDAGARRCGELGIGTNPHLKRHVANGLLVEKIGGSFHVALGDAYKFKEYMGDPVHVDNGNSSALHWDITTMLHGKEGRIYLDGRMIMDHGRFLDETYDVLNRGWEAVPFEDRPPYWQKKFPQSA